VTDDCACTVPASAVNVSAAKYFILTSSPRLADPVSAWQPEVSVMHHFFNHQTSAGLLVSRSPTL
jgi:hypothetical protein